MNMDKKMMAFCGSYCGECQWKDKAHCKGCQQSQGHMSWGECDKAACCVEKGLEHCGRCPEVPCQKLLDLFNEPEHGDTGARLRNLKNWASGRYEYERLENAAQEHAKECKV